ncbi:CopD family protein [Psychroflexus salis]|nr:CopD family protein [Psychroflexus salis]
MEYLYIKSLHLIFVVTWFAGLFYMPRLFIYHIEASERPKNEAEILTEQFKLMSRRLWNIITWPSAILASLFAVWLLLLQPGWLQSPWMHIKLAFVVLLFAYHIKTHFIFKQFQQDIIKWTSNQMRLWNEGATLILFAVVFLAITKTATNWLFGMGGLIGLALLLMLGIKIYKNYRIKKGEQ